MKTKILWLQFFSVCFLIVSIFLFGMILQDIRKIGHPNFDLSRWLDADVYLFKGGWYCLLLAALFGILSLVLHRKRRNEINQTY